MQEHIAGPPAPSLPPFPDFSLSFRPPPPPHGTHQAGERPRDSEVAPRLGLFTRAVALQRLWYFFFQMPWKGKACDGERRISRPVVVVVSLSLFLQPWGWGGLVFLSFFLSFPAQYASSHRREDFSHSRDYCLETFRIFQKKNVCLAFQVCFKKKASDDLRVCQHKPQFGPTGPTRIDIFDMCAVMAPC